MIKFDPTSQQINALKDIKDWYFNEPDKQVFYLAGYAGTGKSTLISYIVDDLGLDIDNKKDVLFGAFTGKAALNMVKKNLINATTIHKMIYIPFEDADGSVTFRLDRYSSPVKDSKLVVIDECSMIDDKMAKDLLLFNTKILVIGDPAQLPPVNGEGAFTAGDPDFFLTEIHRQARDNPIIRLSMDIRDGKQLSNISSEIPIVSYEDDHFKVLLEVDQVITGTNKARRVLNTAMNDHYGYTHWYPQDKGVKLICLKNNHDKGLINGMFFETTSKSKLSKSSLPAFNQSLRSEDGRGYKNLRMGLGPYIDYTRTRDKKEIQKEERSKIDRMDYAYCITVHKSQGSQWDSVALYDDGFVSWDAEARKRFLYTAVTRASETLVIFRS